MKGFKPLSLLLFSSIFSCAYAASFDGYYVGIGADAVSTTMQSTWNASASEGVVEGFGAPGAPAAYSSNSNDTRWNAALSLVLGYGWTINQYYVAPEIGYTGNSNTITAVDRNQVVSSTNFAYQNQASLYDQFNLGVKLGRFITPNNLIYLKPAIAYARMSYSQEMAGSYPSSIAVPPAIVGNYVVSNGNSSIWGEQIGLGYEHAFTQHFLVDAEISYVNFESDSVTGSIRQPISATSTTSFQPYEYRIGLSAVYDF